MQFTQYKMLFFTSRKSSSGRSLGRRSRNSYEPRNRIWQ